MDQDKSASRLAANSGTGMVTGAAIGSVIGAFTGDWGIGLIFGASVGLVLFPGILVLFPGISVAAGKPSDTEGSNESERK
jgi:uncharacterized membrane protein YjjB (DUF3815 family)